MSVGTAREHVYNWTYSNEESAHGERALRKSQSITRVIVGGRRWGSVGREVSARGRHCGRWVAVLRSVLKYRRIGVVEALQPSKQQSGKVGARFGCHDECEVRDRLGGEGGRTFRVEDNVSGGLARK